MNVLKNLDNIILGAPILVCGITGTVSRYMEERANPVVNKIGYVGTKVSMIAGALSGLPLLVWTCSISLIVKLGNLLTSNRYKSVVDYGAYCETRLNIVVVLVPATPILILHGPLLFRMAKKSYDAAQQLNSTWNKSKKALEDLRQSEQYQALTTLYNSALIRKEQTTQLPAETNENDNDNTNKSTNNVDVKINQDVVTTGNTNASTNSVVVKINDEVVKTGNSSTNSDKSIPAEISKLPPAQEPDQSKASVPPVDESKKEEKPEVLASATAVITKDVVKSDQPEGATQQAGVDTATTTTTAPTVENGSTIGSDGKATDTNASATVAKKPDETKDGIDEFEMIENEENPTNTLTIKPKQESEQAKASELPKAVDLSKGEDLVPVTLTQPLEGPAAEATMDINTQVAAI
ncbi:MAG: hypothetical protein H0W88_02630 [Parachlamydiaceae bacterium]|nr:hypothetical protein [Parachlamydiaceae bacterium]